jgi:hypothetical protein
MGSAVVRANVGPYTQEKATVSTHNLGPVGITLSMDVIEDTLALGPYMSCFQDILLPNYSDWRSSDMVNLTMLHKGIFNIQKYTKYEWSTGKDHRCQLGRGRVLWI